jgi:hypothetical protein
MYRKDSYFMELPPSRIIASPSAELVELGNIQKVLREQELFSSSKVPPP